VTLAVDRAWRPSLLARARPGFWTNLQYQLDAVPRRRQGPSPVLRAQIPHRKRL